MVLTFLKNFSPTHFVVFEILALEVQLQYIFFSCSKVQNLIWAYVSIGKLDSHDFWTRSG